MCIGLDTIPQRDGQTDRQIDRQMDRQTDGQTGRNGKTKRRRQHADAR